MQQALRYTAWLADESVYALERVADEIPGG